jgi:hypothetical protein
MQVEQVRKKQNTQTPYLINKANFPELTATKKRLVRMVLLKILPFEIETLQGISNT